MNITQEPQAFQLILRTGKIKVDIWEIENYKQLSVDAIATSTQLYPLLFNTNSDSELSSYSNAQYTFTNTNSYTLLRNTWTKLLSHKSK